ncbi:uncharacterized protein K02A2.6-like [Thrips palmi]|uniref:Uncharacterized protein K02A2.6-like n=1 Tax=Thrips palmi TaxID=161013 RepID=A0A6P8ZMB9_THRPL|nr:uncharacterized protein K02A2.6-like [Thrips palmi]
MDRNWLDILVPQWRAMFTGSIHKMLSLPVPSVDQLKQLYPRIFDVHNDVAIQGFKARLVLKPNATPVLAKAYSLAFGLVETVTKLLNELVASGKIIPVRHAEWASPGVVVQNKDKSVLMSKKLSILSSELVTILYQDLMMYLLTWQTVPILPV